MSCHLNAQNEQEHVDLISYLKIIESHHDVIFSYADEEIKDIILIAPEDLKTLEAHLNYLQKQTAFQYISQTENNILIVPKSNSKTVCISVYDEMTGDKVFNSIFKNK